MELYVEPRGTPVAEPADPRPEPPTRDEVAPPESLNAQSETQSGPDPTQIWAYVALGGAAVAGGLAVWQWQVRESEVDDWNSDGCLKGGRSRRANCEAHEQAYVRAERWAWVAASATLALSGVAVALLLSSRDESAPNQTRAQCLPGPVAFACRVDF